MKKVTLIIAIVCTYLCTNAQTTVMPPKQIALYMELVNKNIQPTDIMANPGIMASQPKNAKVMVVLSDLDNVAKIHVSLGTAKDANDLAQHSFVFDEVENIPAPYSYSREDYTVVLGMGTLTNQNNCHVKVVLEDANGNKSEPKYFGAAQ